MSGRRTAPEHFDTTGRVYDDMLTAGPALKAHVLEVITIQRLTRNAGAVLRRDERPVGRIGMDAQTVIWPKLPQLDEDRAPLRRPRRVTRARRIADVGADRVVTALVLEHTLQNEELLTATVHMRRELAAGRVAHDRRRARHLATDPFQHLALDADHG